MGMLVWRYRGGRRATVPLARVGDPADYAEVIVYLCAGAAYITGEVIPVTGGVRI